MSGQAPIFSDTFRLCAWLLERTRGAVDPLSKRLGDDAISLLDEITLALRGVERPYHLAEADDRLLLLRVHLRLGGEVGLFTEDQLVFVLALTDGVGRQLGGWRRSEGEV